MLTKGWTTSGNTLRMTETGTLRGMPALRDPANPARWSNPPPAGVRPIVPCDDPEEADSVELLSPWRQARLPVAETPLPYLPRRRGMPEEERRLLLHAAVIGFALVSLIVAIVVAATHFSP